MSEGLSPDLEALFEREARAYPEDLALKASVLGSVESAVAVGGTSALAAKSAVAAKVVALPTVALIGVATFIAGASIGYGIHPNGVVASSASSASPAPIPVTPATARPSLVVSAAPSLAPSASAAPSSIASHAPSFEDGDLVRERETLDVARAALAHGHPAEAVAQAQRHERRWPRGYLAEEREVVWIQALVAEGMLTDADARAAKFHARFPQSALAGAVDAAIGANSKTPMTDSGMP